MEEWIWGPVIGRGSTSLVSLCFSPASGQVLAVKSADLSNSASLRREAQLLSKLSSPRVVEYRGFEIRVAEGRPTCDLFMEYAPRGTLHDQIRLRGGRIKESEIRVFLREILLGLEYVHGEGIAHCDIKSQNVLITGGGLKIADFGCARLVEDECAATASASFAGSPAYMSPEAARREEQSYAADVWSVGCMVIEMAMGSLPWMDADDPVSALYRIGYSNEVPEPPHWLTEPARDFVKKCLVRDPRERPTVEELLKHQFLQEPTSEYETGEPKGIDSMADEDSPNGVLEPRLWESMESYAIAAAAERNVLCRPSHSACERMEELIGRGGSPSRGQTDWSSEDKWINVRVHQDEETEEEEEEEDGSRGSGEDILFASEYGLEDSRTIVNDVSGSTIKEMTVVCDAGEEDGHVISHLDPNEDGIILDCCKKEPLRNHGLDKIKKNNFAGFGNDWEPKFGGLVGKDSHPKSTTCLSIPLLNVNQVASFHIPR
ncbi:hypothetical protein MLD38_022078 [Melastoma candidum]|uniref:Uncharacterized protein n=1 Tax=Melastoma candidum TaxID=119954 RepID=A0ACB9QHY3_9MYRT|nr:hypothetical protein MLD38_022078 [Melastoma candidum]